MRVRALQLLADCVVLHRVAADKRLSATLLIYIYAVRRWICSLRTMAVTHFHIRPHRWSYDYCTEPSYILSYCQLKSAIKLPDKQKTTIDRANDEISTEVSRWNITRKKKRRLTAKPRECIKEIHYNIIENHKLLEGENIQLMYVCIPWPQLPALKRIRPTCTYTHA